MPKGLAPCPILVATATVYPALLPPQRRCSVQMQKHRSTTLESCRCYLVGDSCEEGALASSGTIHLTRIKPSLPLDFPCCWGASAWSFDTEIHWRAVAASLPFGGDTGGDTNHADVCSGGLDVQRVKDKHSMAGSFLLFHCQLDKP